MKKFSLIALIIVTCLGASSAEASFYKLGLTVTQENLSPTMSASKKKDDKNKKDDKKKKTAPKPESKTLKIIANVSNISRDPYPDVVVKFYFFGREGGEPKLKIIEEASVPASIDAGAKIQVTSPETTFDFTEAGYSQEEGKSRVRHDAKGKKPLSYGVQVVRGDEILAEYFISSEAKAMVNSPDTAGNP